MEVKERLVALFAEALLAEPGDIETAAEVASLGVDSILAAQLSKLINRHFHIAITPTDIYECISIDGLAVRVSKELAKPAPHVDATGDATDHETDGDIQDDAIVVVGMAARFAGCDGLEAYWRAIMQGTSQLTATERWRRQGAGEFVGGFLPDYDHFDAGFFKISPNEAKCMDPQQRLLMQSAQHAIDDSYLGLEELRELQCGVFAVSLPGDYKFVVAGRPDQAFSTHSFLGNATSTLSGRISYFYDFNGPSLTLDTACSSSLSALHEACLNIQAGHCGAAIVAAASVFSTPELFEFAQRSNMSSPSGRCAAFSDDADGFTPAEGCASVILMRYGEAKVRGLRVYGAIIATGLNHDGKSNGLMAPNAQSQSKLIRDLYRRHEVDVERLAYVETHGTGTHLGDPIEMRGLTEAFKHSGKDYDCLLGAVKPIIGHTLVCSGLAGIIKVMLSFRHETIPPFPPLRKTNALIDFAGFSMNFAPQPWPQDKTLCAVSAFGFTGSNGHVLLQKMPSTRRKTTDCWTGDVLPFCLSAQSRHSLIASVAQLRQLVGTLAEDALYDLSQLLLRRPRYGQHCVVIAANKSDLLSALAQLAHELDAGEAVRDAPLAVRELALSTENLALVTLWRSGEQQDMRRRLEAVASLNPDVDAPVYPFDGKRYWIDDREDEQAIDAAVSAPLDSAFSTDAIMEELRATVSDLLGFAPDELPKDALIEDLGLDSLSALKLLAPYQQRGPGLQAHDLFKYRTLADLATAIAASGVESATVVEDNAIAKAPRENTTPIASGPMAQWLSYGEGRPVILAPPLNTSAEAWTQQINALTQSGRRVLIPIYPGHKNCPFDAAVFSLERLAENMAVFIKKELNSGAVDLVGWSLGGCLSCLIAIHHPDLVRSLTLISTAPSFGDDVFGNTLDLHDELRAHRDILEVVFDGAEDIVASLGAGAPMNVLRYYYDALMRFDVNARLGGIAIPVLLIHGQNDCVIDEATFDQLRRIPQAAELVVEKHGHFIPLTASRFFNTQLLRFLNGEVIG
ncbi:Polyketide synthase modules and related protein [Hahella chejuensis KCTC 2396]|uniref:Polyketide synthase modules and related protein n=1 Tax=Hahella chejuensis (strain KCTC 2396) TaxID=349521 RepID=Q2SGJ4_HAHCH|nr:alpha/beta fold hydrolase [Hahella chejuensis]ABC30230.1 Polyketide synthase modules and related protein [Hahella chejuensis KCTC 2396]